MLFGAFFVKKTCGVRFRELVVELLFYYGQVVYSLANVMRLRVVRNWSSLGSQKRKIKVVEKSTVFVSSKNAG
jgi:hypothetical protein